MNPWITTGILKSIKAKQRPYKTHFLSGNPSEILDYKTYANKLTQLKTQTISSCKVNWKSTWRLIGTLVNHKIKGRIHPTKIVWNSQTFESKSYIVEQFNHYFWNLGAQRASTIKESNDNPLKYVETSPVSIFLCLMLPKLKSLSYEL